MTRFVDHNNISVVTAILPQHNANAVIERIFDDGDRSALLINARGTLVRERWYQALLPVMSPEKEFIQFLVPDREVQRVIESTVDAGELHIPGSGAVFSVPCDLFDCTEDFDLWIDSRWESDDFDASQNFHENLTAIFCIVSPDQTETISRAAMSVGAHGPVVFYSAGRGLRDRLGWLRITKKSDKEVIVVVVDNADAVAVTEAMIDAGDIDLPGRGFLYRLPVQIGLINIASTFGRQRHAASVQQIIAAIDDIKGSSAWRDQRVNDLIGPGKSAGLGLFGKVRQRPYLSGQSLVSAVVARKHAELVMDAALAGGAPGVNVSYGKLIEAEAESGAQGVRFNRERALIRSVLAENQRDAVMQCIKAACEANEVGQACVYAQPVTRAITYVPETAGVAAQ